MYYKHNFNKKESEITADISNYFLTAENRTDYFYSGSEDVMIYQTNTVKPTQNAGSLRIDYQNTFLEKAQFQHRGKGKIAEVTGQIQ